MRVVLAKEFYAEAAHRNFEGTERSARLHGHSLRIEVLVEGEVDSAQGWLIDFGEVKARFDPLYKQLDHSYLNKLEGLENAPIKAVAEWIEARLRPELACLKEVRVSIVGDCAFLPVLLEADERLGLPERWRFTFEAAQHLPQLSEGHPCRRLHGHTYRVEVGAADSEGLRGHLEALYDLLDHRCLNDMPDLVEATSERLCEWIWEKLEACVEGLSVVVVQETNSARCIYHGR